MASNEDQQDSDSQRNAEMDISFLSQYLFGSANIDDEKKEFLKERVEKVCEEALSIQPFKCIRQLRFVSPRITAHPQYDSIKEVINKTPKLKVADVGCAFGTDVRKLILDGATAIYAVDQYRQFWDLGFKLFGGESPERKSILANSFVEGNILDPQFIEKFKAEHGRLNIIHLGSVLHLFEETEISKVLSHMKMLLTSNSSETKILFGRNVGASTPTIAESSMYFKKQPTTSPTKNEPTPTGLRYLHSVESLRDLLQSLGFQNVQTLWIQRPESASYGTLTFYATL